jgi:hypothetical protein
MRDGKDNSLFTKTCSSQTLGFLLLFLLKCNNGYATLTPLNIMIAVTG